MKIVRNKKLTGADDYPVLMDIYSPNITTLAPVVIFAHGFKGFKDWGCWHLIAEAFAKAGFAFIKFNFSHNGTTPENPEEFGDLEAFGRNTYSKEWEDLNVILDWVTADALDFNFDIHRLALIGHSRGGGLSIAKAADDDRIKKLITWAAVPSLAWLWSDETFKTHWKNEGVIYQKNARTGQNMPLYYTLCTNYEANEYLFDLEDVAPRVRQPWLIVHGEADTSVLPSAAQHLHLLKPKALVHLIPDADHTFGGKHPYTSDILPPYCLELVEASVGFLKK
jgi:uncharacterized protein